jgi:hypothetical protein
MCNSMKSSGNQYALPQNDPNGLFSPASAEATWVVMITEDGKSEVQYYEEKLCITQTKKRKQLCEEYSLPADY